MDLQNGLIGHWPLDRHSYDQATHRFIDKSAEENHGTGNGDSLGGTFDFGINQHGIGCGATPFNGSSDYINCGNGDCLSLTNDFTIGVWIKPIGEIAAYYYLGYDASNGLYITTTTAHCRVAGDGSVQADFSFTANNWYYVLWTRTGDSYKCYINGDLKDTDTGLTNTFTLKYIGSRGTPSTYPFTGLIADLYVYNRALSQDETTWLYLERAGVYETDKTPKILEKPVGISKERSLIV